MNLIESLKSTVTLPEGKDKMVYILLAVFLGAYGVHNFWAGNTEKAKAQLIVGLVGLLCCCVGPCISWITAIIDVVKVNGAAK